MRRALAIAALVVTLIVGWFIFLGLRPSLSSDQKNLITIFGYPDHFSITYLPRGDGEELVRSEVWSYGNVGKEYLFLEGKFVSGEDYVADLDIPPTGLHPEDFHYDLTLEDIKHLLVDADIDPVDYLPELAGPDYQMYLSTQAVFVLEFGQLTYFETVSETDLPQPTPVPPIPTSSPTPIPTPTVTPEITPSITPEADTNIIPIPTLDVTPVISPSPAQSN